MKIAKRLVSCVLFVSVFFTLTACSPGDLFTSRTTHSVAPSENNHQAFEVTLEANQDEGYAWYVYAPNGGFDQEDYDVTDGFFNSTLSEHYKYIIRTDDKFDFYLILVKDKNLDTAKVYPYVIVQGASDAEVTEGVAYNIAENMKLYKAVSTDVVLDK